MGSSKEESTTVIDNTQKATATPEETALNQRNLRIALATEGGQTTAQTNSLNLINQLLTGQLPQGELFKMIGGIDPNAIATQATQMMRSGRSGMQSLGLANSGVADRAITQDVASNLLYPASQFNVGAGQNLLNLALSGQAQVQAPVQANVNSLSGSLAGLRTINTTGTQTTTSRSNPFLKSFYSGLGSSLGSGIGGGLVGGLPGFGAGGMFGG